MELKWGRGGRGGRIFVDLQQFLSHSTDYNLPNKFKSIISYPNLAKLFKLAPKTKIYKSKRIWPNEIQSKRISKHNLQSTNRKAPTLKIFYFSTRLRILKLKSHKSTTTIFFCHPFTVCPLAKMVIRPTSEEQ